MSMYTGHQPDVSDASGTRPDPSLPTVCPFDGAAGRARTGRPWAELWAIPLGAVAGAALGAVARGWMRLVTDEPEFSWSGTIFIVVAFTITGFGHGLARAFRRLARRRRWSTVARAVGAVLTLPLFVGAGAMMLPTVVGASLCRWRTAWPRPIRVLAALLAVPVPVLLVVEGVRGGLSAREALGLVLIGATYALIVTTMQPIVAQVDDGWRMPRAARVALVAVGVLALAALAVGVTGLDA